jgi:hypothetical protein
MSLQTGMDTFGNEITPTPSPSDLKSYWNVLLSLPTLRKLETFGSTLTLHDIATRARSSSLSLTSLYIYGAYESTKCEQRDIVNAVCDPFP